MTQQETNSIPELTEYVAGYILDALQAGRLHKDLAWKFQAAWFPNEAVHHFITGHLADRLERWLQSELQNAHLPEHFYHPLWRTMTSHRSAARTVVKLKALRYTPDQIQQIRDGVFSFTEEQLQDLIRVGLLNGSVKNVDHLLRVQRLAVNRVLVTRTLDLILASMPTMSVMDSKRARRFELHRDHDATGVSGTGVVAEGCKFSNGQVVVTWLGKHHTITTYPNGMSDVEAVHSHGGATRIVWVDE